MRSSDNRGAGSLAVRVATVGGLGHMPWAPGTWGSLLGLGLGLIAVRVLSGPIMLVVLGASFVAGAVICGRAEQGMGQHDPPNVILDEVWGMFAVLAVLPDISASWGWLIAAFLLFRAFDIVKPPPLKRLARLPGGWGIMADDAGAAAYAIGMLWLLQKGSGAF